jgi:3-oxoacyl-(acyl-carrier-protein) synthase
VTRRVVITGVGVVSAPIVGPSAVLEAYLASPRATAGGVSPAALAELIDEASARRLSRASQLTLAAARLAATDARCGSSQELGVVVGTEFGDLHSTAEFADGYLERGPAGLSPLLFPNTVMNTMAAATAIALSARSLSLTVNAPAVAGELAVARAVAAIGSARAARLIAGGVDQLGPLVTRVLASLGSGDARGEGAAFLVLEPLSAARERGVTPLGEILSAASAALPARPHKVGRSSNSRVIAAALDHARLAPADIGWIYASASGDIARDAWERSLLERALAPHGPPVTSFGALIGHHSGLGALRVAAAAWTARTGLLPVADLSASPKGARVGRVRAGPGLVHGVARGGAQVALVVGPPPSTS